MAPSGQAEFTQVVPMGKLKDILTDEEAERAGDVFSTHQRFIESVAAQHAAPDQVPDIVQDVAVRVCRGLNGFRSESEITTWLYRVTVNRARSHYQRERRQHLAVEAITTNPVPEPTFHPDDHVAEGERLAALSAAVERLRPQDRAIICDEVQDVGVLLHDRRARHRARQRLKQLLVDDPRLEPYGTPGSSDDTQD